MARGFRKGTSTTRKPPGSTQAPRGTNRNTGGVVDHALHDHAVHVIPWVILAMFWLVGTLLHAFVQYTWSRVGTVALILLATVGLVYSVIQTQQNRPGTALWHGVVTAVTGGVWLAVCTVTGFVTLDGTAVFGMNPHGFTISTFCVAGAALAVIWNTRITARKHGAELAEAIAQMQPEETPMEKAGHGGSVMMLRRVTEHRSEGTVRLSGGDTLKEFQRDILSVESAHGFPPNSMTVTQRVGQRDARICDVTVMHSNPIEDAQPWPGLLVGVTAK